MAKMSRVKRIMDLFTEGKECRLGEDEMGTAVLVWVNKPNSFEEDEAIKDGRAARSVKLTELDRDDNADVVNLRDVVKGLSDDELADQIAASNLEDDYLLAMDDVDSDEKWREKNDYLTRGGQLLIDQGIPDDDPRWEDLNKTTQEYTQAISEAIDKRQAQRKADLKQLSREENIESYEAAYKHRIAMDDFIGEKRITELFYALRDCQAIKQMENGRWDHSNCDHSVRLLDDRSEVRQLPEQLLQAASATLNELMVDMRAVGNSPAPQTSSGSSEQPSASEAASTPSTQEVTSSAAPST